MKTSASILHDVPVHPNIYPWPILLFYFETKSGEDFVGNYPKEYISIHIHPDRYKSQDFPLYPSDNTI